MKKKKLTPFVQLFHLLQTDEQKTILYETIEPLDHLHQDDFCLACVAYIRFGIRRQFQNRVMQVLFTSYCEVLDY